MSDTTAQNAAEIVEFDLVSRGYDLCLGDDWFLCETIFDFFPLVDDTKDEYKFKISKREFEGAKRVKVHIRRAEYFGDNPYSVFYFDEEGRARTLYGSLEYEIGKLFQIEKGPEARRTLYFLLE